jgi:hypothetical protein
VRVFHRDAVWAPQTLPGNNGNTIITPVACRMSDPHVAGPGEQAIISMTATATPSNPATDVLYVNVMRNLDSQTSAGGFTFYTVTNVDNAESFSDGTANASTQKVVALDEGHVYRFGVGVSSNSSTSISTGYCTMTVTIVKAATQG